MWQLCPKCDGNGTIFPVGNSTTTTIECPVCKGAQLISTLTGFPRLMTSEERIDKLKINQVDIKGKYITFNREQGILEIHSQNEQQ